MDSRSDSLLSMYDWGGDFNREKRDHEYVVVQFKNQRTDFFLNPHLLPLQRGDVVTVNGAPGTDVGIVVITGWLARRSYIRGVRGTRDRRTGDEELRIVYRRATVYDVERWMHYVAGEREALVTARRLTREVDLDIKVSDVEYQGDGSRLTVYYSSAHRVDFRAYVRALSLQLGCKVFMRQYNNRQEASVVGGIGACGRTLCCSTWLHELRSVVTSDIKGQDLALHYQRYAGQCEKLKCCLKFELDAYTDARQHYPRLRSPLQLDGEVELFHVKNDLFRGIMWFSQDRRSAQNLVMLTVPQVERILECNGRGESGGSLADYQQSIARSKPSEDDRSASYGDLLEQDSITRFDKKSARRGRRRGPGGGGKSAPKARGQRGSQAAREIPPLGPGANSDASRASGGSRPDPKPQSGQRTQKGQPRGEQAHRPRREVALRGEGGNRPAHRPGPGPQGGARSQAGQEGDRRPRAAQGPKRPRQPAPARPANPRRKPNQGGEAPRRNPKAGGENEAQ